MVFHIEAQLCFSSDKLPDAAPPSPIRIYYQIENNRIKLVSCSHKSELRAKPHEEKDIF